MYIAGRPKNASLASLIAVSSHGDSAGAFQPVAAFSSSSVTCAPFGGSWMPYARAFYTAESMGLVDRTHDAMFEAIHVQRRLSPQNASDQQIAGFYADHGADAAQFASTMQSFTVNAKLKRAEQFLARAGDDATPTLVVNGRYRVLGGRAFEEQLNTVEHLVARERDAR